MSTIHISADHFSRELTPARARTLFKASVNQVEIETFTYCNRTCWFCPNARLDRRSTNRYMDEALYLRILEELSAIGYDQVITYRRYNEPLADRIILERLRQARRLLTKACLSTHTNGDYLNRAYLDELRDAGLNQLRVQVYLGNEERFDDDKILLCMVRRMKRLGLPYEMILASKGVRYMAQVAYEGVAVTFDARNFDAIGVDRGQTVRLSHTIERRSPCHVVFQHLYIDHDGAVVPCCNIRSDEPSHTPYVIDHLGSGNSLYHAFANSPLAEWRRGLLTFGVKHKPCNSCAYECLPETPELSDQLVALARQFGLE
jgi:hypothetical protein